MARITPTVFHEDWWLDAASNRKWYAVELPECPNAWMPYFTEELLWLKRSRMPMLTHFLGPVVTLTSNNLGNKAQESIALTRHLIQKLPKFDCFRQTMHRGIKDVLAFQMEGFNTSAQFTFVIQERELGAVWKSMRDKLRNAIRSAQKRLTVHDDMTTEAFIETYRRYQGKHRPVAAMDLLIAFELITQARSRGRGQVYAALDCSGNCQAAIFCAWDADTTYYLMSTRSLDSHYGAVSLLLWHVIQYTCSNGRVFDFDGVAFAGSASFFASFGASCEPRFVVSKITNKYSIYRRLDHFIFNKSEGLSASA